MVQWLGNTLGGKIYYEAGPRSVCVFLHVLGPAKSDNLSEN